MANTIAGVNLAAIAQESIPALMSQFMPLAAFMRDFSADISDRGESVTTRVPTVPTAQDLSTGYSATDVAMSKFTITLDTFFGFVWGFTDVERSKSSINLNDLFIDPAASALATKVFGDIWDLINDTNLPASTHETIVTAANFDRDAVADLATELTNKKVPQTGRSLLLNPTYYGALTKDLNSVDTAGQSMSIGEHVVPRLHGFNVFQSDQVDGNTQNVTGWAGARQNLLMAARSVDDTGAASAGVDVETITLPDLGLPVQFRRWYDPDAGLLKYSMGVLYGVKFGVQDAGRKIVSA